MLIHSATQLLTLAGGPQRGDELGSLGILENGAVLIRDEKIVAVGKTDELRAAYPGEPSLDASGCVVMPGFVDPHTHLIWGGDRAREFEMRLEGAKYLDILAAGGFSEVNQEGQYQQGQLAQNDLKNQITNSGIIKPEVFHVSFGGISGNSGTLCAVL